MVYPNEFPGTVTVPGGSAWILAARDYTQPGDNSTTTVAPWSFLPRTLPGTASRVRPSFPRQTLVFQDCPSTVARTGVRPQACVGGGACFAGMDAKTQPPFPGYRNSFDLNRVERGAFPRFAAEVMRVFGLFLVLITSVLETMAYQAGNARQRRKPDGLTSAAPGHPRTRSRARRCMNLLPAARRSRAYGTR